MTKASVHVAATATSSIPCVHRVISCVSCSGANVSSSRIRDRVPDLDHRVADRARDHPEDVDEETEMTDVTAAEDVTTGEAEEETTETGRGAEIGMEDETENETTIGGGTTETEGEIGREIGTEEEKEGGMEEEMEEMQEEEIQQETEKEKEMEHETTGEMTSKLCTSGGVNKSPAV